MKFELFKFEARKEDQVVVDVQFLLRHRPVAYEAVARLARQLVEQTAADWKGGAR
jgi:hypothetical protein